MNDKSITNEYIVPVDLGCVPHPSGADGLLIQNERETYVIFDAIATQPTTTVAYASQGVAVVRCQGCSLTWYGYPNDEGLPEHPLYAQGLTEASICEVINSLWKARLEAQMDTSARRIWGEHYYKAYKVPVGGKREFHLRHFIFQFKEGTLECITEKLILEAMIGITPTRTYHDVVAEILDRIL